MATSTECPTCRKPLKRATSRHKCFHGVWCGIPGRPQLSSRSRTCKRCNAEIKAERAAGLSIYWSRASGARTAKPGNADLDT